MKKKYYYGIILLLVWLDQGSKYLFYNLNWGDSFFLLNPVLNIGISRSIQFPFLLIILFSLLGIAFFIYALSQKWINWWMFVFFISGAVGNLLDRILIWGVRDFVALGNFPVFNLADTFLTIAVILLLTQEIFLLQSREKNLNW